MASEREWDFREALEDALAGLPHEVTVDVCRDLIVCRLIEQRVECSWSRHLIDDAATPVRHLVMLGVADMATAAVRA